MTTQKAVALRVSNLLAKNNMTVYSLCKKIAMPEETLRSIINLRYKTVKIDTIFELCDGFNISIVEFFDDDLFKKENLDID